MPIKYAYLTPMEKSFVDRGMVLVKESIQSIENTLKKAIQNRSELKEPMEGYENFFLFMPHVKPQFEVMRNDERLEFADTLVSFIQWCTLIEDGLRRNEKMLKNKKVLEHLTEVFGICVLIEEVFEIYKTL